jgi:uncharacterized lipoprotein NlpE involved in copper resistance
MKKFVKKSIIAILALIGILMISGCENVIQPEEDLYGPPPMDFDDSSMND